MLREIRYRFRRLLGLPVPAFGYIDEDGHAYVVYSDGTERRGGGRR